MSTVAQASTVSAQETDSDSWCTSSDLARLIGHFCTDPCSNSRSHVQADRSYAIERREDGLIAPWGWSVYVNPPYSDPLPWARRLAAHAGPWVALVKLDPTTEWYRLLRLRCTDLAPFRKRLKFERPDKPTLTANFPSLLVWHWWQPSAELARHLWLPTYTTDR